MTQINQELDGGLTEDNDLFVIDRFANGGYQTYKVTLGDMAQQMASDVTITGGTITDVTWGDLALTNPTLTGGYHTEIANQGLSILDTGGDNTLTFTTGENLTGDRRIYFNPNDGNRSLTILADSTLSGGNTGDQTTSGTSGRITVTNGSTNPVIDISATYAGQNTIAHLGTIVEGVWNGTTLGIAYGGTGQTTATAAINALLPSQTGNSGKVLSTNGSAASWATAATGTVTSVDVSGGSTGLSASGGPITSSGTITLGGTLAIGSGGTGQTTKTTAFDALSPLTTKGDLIGFNGTNNVRVGVGTDGYILTADSASSSGFKWAVATASGVSSVSGTTDRITSTGGSTPVIDIAATYVGQTSITTLGTIATGTWNGSTLGIGYGGTGQTTANAALNALLPSQASANGKVLTSDGTNTSWTSVGGTGTVTSVSVTTANGVSGSVATATTTPAITLTLGAITPSSVAAVGSVTGSNLSGTNTGDQTITLTGDVTGSGTGSFTATLATVNANVGSFGSSTAIPSFTVNGKGLITAASTNAVVAPAGTLSGTTLNSTVVSSSLTSVGTISTGVWNGTKIGLAYGGTNADLSATGGTSQVLKQTTLGGNITVGQLAASDLSNGTQGSGAVVLANTPTLTTPNIGAATGTSLSVSGQLTSTVATGTAPLVVSSTTQVANLNAATAGNASTATALQTARAIYGNNFDGTAALTQIIASTYGGTGNGFTKFSGPTTAEKTFTLPNASATILTDNALVTVAQGGTGVGTATAYAVLCGGTTTTNPLQSVASVGTSGQVLTSNGAGALPTFQTPAASGASTGLVVALAANNYY